MFTHITLHVKSNGIIKDFEKKSKFKNADWDKFKSIIDREIDIKINNEPLEGGGINQERIDNAITNWIKIVKVAKEESVPKSKVNYYIHPKVSDYIKLLEQNYKQLTSLNHWSREQLIQIRNIQEQLKEESKRLHTEMWNNKIQKVNSTYKDPAKFWGDIKVLMGGKGIKNSCIGLLDANNTKIHEPKDKEKEFRSIWTNVFKITDEENQNFDQDNETMVTEYLNEHQQQTQPYPFVDLSRLDPNNYLIKPVTTYDIISTIKEFKNNKAPGESGINKILLIQLPNSAIDRL